MARKSSTNSNSSSCAICESSNLASICASCVNYRLNDYYSSLKHVKRIRNLHYQKLERKLEAKRKMDEQLEWRVIKNEKIAKLKMRLHFLQKQLKNDKTEAANRLAELKAKSESMEFAFSMLRRTRVELLERFYLNLKYTQNLGLMGINKDLFHKQSVVIQQISNIFPMRRVISAVDNKDNISGSYDQICNARLPRGLDPHSVPSEELSVSLGYMVQILDFLVPKLAAPALHNSGFMGSCSRIWQRDSYWNNHPSSQSKEYPLFIPRKNFCASGEETTWSDKSSSNFGVASVDSGRKPYLDAGRSSSFNYSSSSHSMDTHKDLQKGISLLKKSVACITAYLYNSLWLDVPPEASTFDAFAKLLATLSDSKEMRLVLSLKMASPRSNTRGQQLSTSTRNTNAAVSSSNLTESTRTVLMPRDNLLSNSDASFLYSSDKNIVDEWDIVEHPTLPPPPSQVENVEHWTRAMFIDATKK